MQRNFPTFPGGPAGMGLLLLRLTAATGLFWCDYALFTVLPARSVLMVLAVLAIASAVLLLIGHLARLAALTAVVVEFVIVGATLSVAGPYMTCVRLGAIFTLILGIALSCLGPGLFSVDAQRYGRREIIISYHK